MSLHLHRADRTDVLADALGELLATPLPDPFAEEVVVVPAKGVERWLTQRLSHRLGTGPRGADGVCAGVRFLNPRSLVAMLIGTDRDDPWDPDRFVWPLLEVVDESLGEPWCATLATHLGAGLEGVELELRQGRRYSVARRLTGLFASYAVQRPGLLADWTRGRETDGCGAPLDPDLCWQPRLWQRLVDRVPAPAPDVRHATTLAAVRDGAPLALPDRLSLFGHTRLPVTEVELLAAVAEVREVHLWLPQVSEALWQALAPHVAEGPVRRSDDRSAELVGHPLLASLGRDAREVQRTLAPVPAVQQPVEQSVPRATADAPGTLLGWLQHDLRTNAEPPPATRAARVVDPADRSVSVHACHGPSRQVDVLREVLVGLLQDDPSLEPRDILVMCPDVEAYAPLVQAAFGLGATAAGHLGDGHPGHELRVRLADRGLLATNPLLQVASRLVGLAGGRATASEVLDLLGEAPVRRRFGLDDRELEQLARWVAESGVRWGLTREHRAAYHLDTVGQNTWRAGLDRVLLGVAVSGSGLQVVGRTLPVDDVGSGSVDLAGRLTEALDRIERAVDALAAAGPVAAWTRALREGVAALTSVAPLDAWQFGQLERELAAIADGAGEGTGEEGGTRLRIADVRGLLGQRLAGRPTRANFRTGTLTVCTMVPMRSVPHRVVCLLGLDDGVFPRMLVPDGDDALARHPMTGERDVRSEDRQLLLDAVMAATERLVVSYSGASEHTGQERPPAVPVGELLDALDRTAATPVRSQVLVRHPLQPFDVRNLTPGQLGTPGPFSFDQAALQGALAARAERATPTLLTGELPPPEGAGGDLTLEELTAFFRNPARAFLRRLDVALPTDVDEVRDAIPIELDGLESWAVGDRVVAALLDGADADAVCTAELLRGELPPGDLGPTALRDILETAQVLLDRSASLRQGDAETPEVLLDLGDGRRLTGSVDRLYAGHQLVRLTWSRLAAKHALAAWLDLLALQAARPETELTAHVVGKAGKGQVAHAVLGPVDAGFAHAHLRTLVELRDVGLCRPLPLPVATGRAWALGREQSTRKATWLARDRWKPRNFPGESEDAAFCRVLGQGVEIATLEAQGLGELATRVWSPLRQHERGWPG
ncbi:MAG TPA: exodeoxyribonuclease V subunit gamma [Marmoricola sp.]|nr:exodeoxyribonuclease V subunit gamma [Marmoricola sp.]